MNCVYRSRLPWDDLIFRGSNQDDYFPQFSLISPGVIEMILSIPTIRHRVKLSTLPPLIASVIRSKYGVGDATKPVPIQSDSLSFVREMQRRASIKMTQTAYIWKVLNVPCHH